MSFHGSFIKRNEFGPRSIEIPTDSKINSVHYFFRNLISNTENSSQFADGIAKANSNSTKKKQLQELTNNNI